MSQPKENSHTDRKTEGQAYPFLKYRTLPATAEGPIYMSDIISTNIAGPIPLRGDPLSTYTKLSEKLNF